MRKRIYAKTYDPELSDDYDFEVEEEALLLLTRDAYINLAKVVGDLLRIDTEIFDEEELIRVRFFIERWMMFGAAKEEWMLLLSMSDERILSESKDDNYKIELELQLNLRDDD